MPINFKLLTKMMAEMQYDANFVNIFHLAIDKFPGEALFFNSDIRGVENLRLSSAASNPNSIPVNVTNVDFLYIVKE